MMTFALFSVLIALGQVDAHIAMWNKGLFGYNYPGQAGDATQYWNNNEPVGPLRESADLTTSEWFGHGLKGYPPIEGDFMELESGGTFTGELACNRAWTHMRNPDISGDYEYYACPDSGPLHTVNKFGQAPDPKWLAGTSIAIAYTSDADALQPSDMTVISVNAQSVWTREVNYDIPSGLPSCPEGGCLCTWNWIHQSGDGEGYGTEIYNNLFRCTVTGNTNNNNRIGTPSAPKYCGDDSSKCVSGPKQPLYIWMKDGNNLPSDSPWPFYKGGYGYQDGAQTDLFDGSSKRSVGESRSIKAGAQAPFSVPGRSEDNAVEEQKKKDDDEFADRTFSRFWAMRKMRPVSA